MAEPKKKAKAKASSVCTAEGAEEMSTELFGSKSSITPEEARLRITCALLSSPRFAVKIEDERVQDLLIDTAGKIAGKLGL